MNFKNYEEATLSFDSDVVCFVGKNGGGKTNLLDAIHYLGLCKSYFNAVDSQNIRHGEQFFVVQGAFKRRTGEEEIEQVYCGVKKGKKKVFRRNKKEYERLADHVGEIPVVMITPYDIDLILDGSEVRRRFLDSIIAQYDRTYLDHVMRYNKVLNQRNTFLKRTSNHVERELLEVWDEQLSQHATYIHTIRKEFLEGFNDVFLSHYRLISGEVNEDVALAYRSQLNEVSSLKELLGQTLDKDRMLKHTSAGIHKDDLVFTLGDRPLKKFGSQGQQKSFLIALKMAQMVFLKTKKNKKPILLLDDIFDKLDADRVKSLMHTVAQDDYGQVFISDTHADRLPALLESLELTYQLFEVQEGKV